MLEPTKTGYVFEGWFADVSFAERIYVINKMTGDISLYAKWRPIKYTVQYNPNKAVAGVTTSQHTYDTVAELKPNSFSRAGYEFIGWSESENGSVEYLDGGDVCNLASVDKSIVNLYAVWKANEYRVVYNSNGGNGVMNYSTHVYGVSKPLAENAFTKKGYAFAGWSKSEDGKAEYGDGESVISLTAENGVSVDLYAVWTALTYTVTLDKQGGTGGAGSITVKFGTAMPKNIVPPTRKGYAFKGFFSEKNGGGTQYYDANNPMRSKNVWNIDSDSTLYAHWKKKTYTLTFDNGEQCSSRYYSATVAYGSKMPDFRFDAPVRNGYEFVGYFSMPNGEGTQYYTMNLANDINAANKYGYEKYMVESIIPLNVSWRTDGNATLYAHWKLLECEYYYNNYGPDNVVLSVVSTHLVHGQSVTLVASDIENAEFQYFKYKEEEHWQATVVLNDIQLFRDYDGYIRPRDDFFAVYKGACVAEGTLITLANGTQVPVETLTGEEELLAWNLFTGSFEAAPILLIDSEPPREYDVILLTFSDGTEAEVISEHGFWDYDLGGYVYLGYDAEKYVGHSFCKIEFGEDGPYSTKTRLTGVSVSKKLVAAYSPVTSRHLCYYVNGMLSVPGGITGLFNIFETDTETMTVNAEAMARDVETYGLFTYEEFRETFDVPEEIFEAFNGRYLKVAIGKGLTNEASLLRLIERYSPLWNGENV